MKTTSRQNEKRSKTQNEAPHSRKTFKYASALYIAAVSLLFLSNYTGIFDEKIDMNGDNIHYYSLGTAIAQGKGFTNVMGFTESPHSHFPPGYPYFIAFLMKIGIKSIHAIKVTNGVLLLLSLILIFFVFRNLCGNKFIAFVGTAFAASQISVLRFATIMMSEMLFLFFTLVVFLLIRHLNRSDTLVSKKRRKDVLPLCLLFVGMSCIYFIRVMGLSLLLSVIAYFGIRFLHGGFVFLKNRGNDEQAVSRKKGKAVLKYGILLVVASVSILFPKYVMDSYNSRIKKSSDAYVGTFYTKSLGGTMETFADWNERLKSNSVNYLTKWIPSAVFNYTADTNTKPSAGEWAKGIAIFALMMIGVFKLRETSLLMFFYMGATLAVLLLYPEYYGGHRYMTPVIPFLIFLLIYGAWSVIEILSAKILKPSANREKYAKVTAVVTCLIFAIIAIPLYSKEIKKASSTAQFKDYTTANTTPPLVEYLDAIRWVKNNLPDTARVSTRKPELFYIYSGGRKSMSFPYYATPEEVMKYLTENNIQYIIIDRWFRHAYATIMPAVQQNLTKFSVAHQIKGKDKDANPTYVLKIQ